MTRTRTRNWDLLLLVFGLLLGCMPVSAIEISGNARVWAGPSDSDGTQQDQLDQRYRLDLRQALTPYLSILAAYRFVGFDSDFETGEEFFRRNQGPELSLFYDRQTFSARLSATDRQIRTSQETQNLDVRRYLAFLEWRPLVHTRFILRGRDETNTADPALFGRQTESQILNFAINHQRVHWSLRYGFDASDISNTRNESEIKERRHELRATYADRWWDGRWLFSLDARGAHIDRREKRPAGSVADVPVPTSQGLFAVDTSPDVGELDLVPGLIDGDFDTPVSPPIDIGGANSFRNIGVDLGISRPITGLEITVDRPSSATVAWAVYESSDNLNWFLVPGVTSVWDAGFLRYTLRFPETINRIFKAVNLSANPATAVLVTEMRALVSSTAAAEREDSGPEYWVNLNTTLKPVERVDLSLLGSFRRDLSLYTGGFGRNRDTRDLGARARIALHRDLELRLGYRATDFEESVDPVLLREQRFSDVALEWRPLPTVDILLSAGRRDEDEDGRPLASNTNLLLRAYTELLPALSLVSEISQNSSEDRIGEFSQDSQQWRERLEARPNDRWTIWLGFYVIRYDSGGRSSLSQRNGGDLRVIWTATNYLSLTADLNYGEDDFQDTLTQRYSVAWTPGQRLSFSAVWQSVDTADARGTTTGSALLNYRLNRMLTFWSSYSSSETVLIGFDTFDNTSLRFGVNIVF